MDDRRLTEDYLPIQAISKEASREKSVREVAAQKLGHARREIVAVRFTDVPAEAVRAARKGSADV